MTAAMKATTNRLLRRLHLYAGTFFAPAILFFAVSGGLQTFRLTELPGAPAWTRWLDSVHKDQSAPRPKRPHAATPPTAASPPASRPSSTEPAGESKAARHDPLALKIFVALMSLGLTVSTGLGIAVALSIASLRRVSLILLAAGTVLPVVLLLV